MTRNGFSTGDHFRPLNPNLYFRLGYLFGRVDISNPGYAVTPTYLPALGYPGRFDLILPEGGEHYRVSCPYCHDTRGRLYLHYLWGRKEQTPDGRYTYNAHLATCFNEDCLSVRDRQWQLRCRVYSVNRPVTPIHCDSSSAVVSVTRQPASWPGRCVSLRELSADAEACMYLRSRGFDPGQLTDDFDVRLCVEADERFPWAINSLIVPVFDRQELVGWQARRVEWVPSGKPRSLAGASAMHSKYMTMPGFSKSRHLYNLDQARRSPYVVVCEGVTDVWAVGSSAVALLGKRASPTQLAAIADNWKRVVVALDNDTEKEGDDPDTENLLRALSRRQHGGEPLRLSPLRLPPGCDPASVDPAIRARLLEEAIQR